MSFEFRRKRVDTLPESNLIDELEKAAKHFNYIEFGWRDFNTVAGISASTIKKHFGSWKKGIEILRQHLITKGLVLSPRPYSPNRIHSDEDLFREMERIWIIIGQRPSRTEWEMNKPKIAYNTYKQRFGSWTNACLKFIEYKMGSYVNRDDFIINNIRENKSLTGSSPIQFKQGISRNVPVSLRYKVLKRDNYRCTFCGKSPVTNFGTILHIDHKIPFSKGGKSSLENLQTLCEECNLGKSDKT
jgi:hypothetical protein